MSHDMIALQALLEKSSDSDWLREMIGFAAHRLMELEVEGLTGLLSVSASLESARYNAMATVAGTGKHGQVLWSCVNLSCARAAISRAFWSPGA